MGQSSTALGGSNSFSVFEVFANVPAESRWRCLAALVDWTEVEDVYVNLCRSELACLPSLLALKTDHEAKALACELSSVVLAPGEVPG